MSTNLLVFLGVLEAIPAIGDNFAKLCGKKVQRVLKWTIDENLKAHNLRFFLQSTNFLVKCIHEPTEAKKFVLLFEQMTLIDDEDDACVGREENKSTNGISLYVYDTCRQNGVHRIDQNIAFFISRLMDQKIEGFKHAVLEVVQPMSDSIDSKLDDFMKLVKEQKNSNTSNGVAVDVECEREYEMETKDLYFGKSHVLYIPKRAETEEYYRF